MLIWMNDSIMGADLSVDTDACIGLTSLLDAFYRGHHYVLGEKILLKKFSTDINLSLATRNILKKMLADYSAIKPIFHKIKSKINVIYDEKNHFVRRRDDSWDISINFFGTNGLQKTILITENIIDSKIVEIAARHYGLRNGLGRDISLERRSGGGSTTPVQFESSVNADKRFSVCVTDSDRLYPNQSMDSTADKCRNVSEKSSGVSCFYDIKYREIENIIPLKFLEDVIPPTHSYCWERHNDVVIKKSIDAHYFGDLKLGVSLKKIFSYGCDSPERKFWNSIAKLLFEENSKEINCIELGYCNGCLGGGCDCIIMHGYGEKILESISDGLGKVGDHAALKSINNDINSHYWFELGGVVFEWCCAPRKTTSR